MPLNLELTKTKPTTTQNHWSERHKIQIRQESELAQAKN